jgi:dTDP-4-dehydrorhamnose reductase
LWVTVSFNEENSSHRATGQLGSELKVIAQKAAAIHWFCRSNYGFLDNILFYKAQLEQIQPDVIFNCGAYTAVDKGKSTRIGQW